MATHLRITKEWALNFLPSPLPPSQPANNHSQAKTEQAAGIWHTCAHHLCHSNTWFQECWVYTPGKGEGRGEKLGRGSFLGRLRKQSLVDACSTSVGKEGPCPALFSFLFNISVPLHPWGKGNVSCQRCCQPASHLEGWEIFDLGHSLLPVSSTLHLLLSFAPLDAGFYPGISEKCSQENLECKTLYTLRSSRFKQQPLPPAIKRPTQLSFSPHTFVQHLLYAS